MAPVPCTHIIPPIFPIIIFLRGEVQPGKCQKVQNMIVKKSGSENEMSFYEGFQNLMHIDKGMINVFLWFVFNIRQVPPM